MADLRQAFFDSMMVLAKKDKDIMVLVGDLGYSFMEEYRKFFPDQFINCGIAEQNMIGVAAGLARVGKKPYVYSGSVFLIARAYEQLRDDVAYQNLNVKLVGTGAAGFLGFTHNWEGNENPQKLLEDLPNLRYYKPENSGELMTALKTDGPVFIQT